MKRILVIIVCLVTAPALGQADRKQIDQSKSRSGDIEQELIDLEKRWSEAYLKKDIDTLKRIMADDIVIVYGDGSRGTKAQDIANIGKDEQVDSNVLNDFHVRVHADNAVVMSRLISKGIRHGKRFDAQFRYIDVFERRDGRWQCVITQNTHVGKVEL